ncbi:MAG: hypothetical protein CMP49_01370 [Flavobacteriales bacterium]|jgi:para-nitrobenzyl esterase|nr:hypothetical protein [Flavobacteriales bacterium]|tara:strand:- start:15635 stop:16795 length:1161 start_codon:yes stop_codon:yes gene_type:complete
MKNIILFLIFNFLLAFNISAQVFDCNCDNRYEMEIFDSSDINVQTTTYSDTYNLQMDIYSPDEDVDICSNRPLIILAHGGSFIGGSKTNPTMVDLCETFARRGYVAASINYRLATNSSVLGPISGLFWMTNLENGIKVIYSAMTDAKAAVRFFRKDFSENGNQYGIDNNQIWMGGNSAGACLGPHMHYINSLDEFVSGIDLSGQDYALNLANQNGGIDGNSGNSGYSSSISGMINLAGALHTIDWIDEFDTAPIVSCHGTEDETVPDECGTILNSPNNLTACGSMAIHPIISTFGVTNDLLIYDGEAHCPWDVNAIYKQQMIDFVTSFVYNNINCPQTDLYEQNFESRLVYEIDILGRASSDKQDGFIIKVYEDGTVHKEYRTNNK